ncbi:gliding motility lipoprotein GldD [Zhouia sp. PK063]|uniref:gliding motility lipoprotein GldD n=1 Tax=Zhouia sp. PK063 TaxID=3373602 RepID=UPI0037BD1C82
MKSNLIIIFSLFILVSSCKKQTLPKPKALLRLDYPKATYDLYAQSNYQFLKNDAAKASVQKNEDIDLEYTTMKATIYISYKQVNNNIEQLLKDAQKLTYEHVVKADNIVEQPFVNKKDKVYGMFYKVSGNAASQSQFYVTDSTQHFLTGSVYFYAKPNYDSIYPAAMYLENDIRKIMESIQWK